MPTKKRQMKLMYTNIDGKTYVGLYLLFDGARSFYLDKAYPVVKIWSSDYPCIDLRLIKRIHEMANIGYVLTSFSPEMEVADNG